MNLGFGSYGALAIGEIDEADEEARVLPYSSAIEEPTKALVIVIEIDMLQDSS